MNRLSLLNINLSSKNGNKYVDSSYHYLNFNELLPDDVEGFRKNLREELDREVKPHIFELVEKAEFPEKLIPVFKKLDLGRYYLDKPYGEGKDIWKFIVVIIELSRLDASLATFFLVHHCLFLNTLETFGNKTQKDALIPKARNYDIIGGWGLTEKDIGSDASNITTTIRLNKEKTGQILNGNKRWIGNANKDYIIVNAKDLDDKGAIKAYLLKLNSKGVKREAIKHKISLRMVQNMKLEFDNVELSLESKLPNVNSFKDINISLEHSRLYVCWVAVGVGIGIYDFTIDYLNKRIQFNKQLTKFQLVQEKLVRIMAKVQSCLLLAKRITDLYYNNKYVFSVLYYESQANKLLN